MRIEILGTGCYNCIKLELLVDEILQDLGKRDVQVIRVGDERNICKYISLDEIPGLVINGWLASIREVPEREILQDWLTQAMEQGKPNPQPQ